MMSSNGGSDEPPVDSPDERTILDSSEPDTPVGKRFSGCLVERKLGQGGMGTVYLATRESDGEPVVLKFLALDQASNPTWRARFVREASLMKKLSHPNIVRVFEVENEGIKPYMVMEYVNGQGLDALLKAGPIDPLEAVRICRDVAKGLAHAHQDGIIHRDIKPANVLLTKAREVKILDFGLAKEVLNDDGLSMPGQALGTPHYMAPEQWGDHKVDARCDVYSLGVTLYQLLTKQLPFLGSSPSEISRKVAAGSFTRPRAHVPALSEDLELAILQMMALDRRFRYGSAGRCMGALEAILAGTPIEVPRLVERKGGKRHALVPGSTFTIGRETTCEVPVLDRTVSRQHARIERTLTGYVIHDLGSTSGTFVGGMRVKDVVLKDKDEVRVGSVVLDFRDEVASRTVTTRKIDQKLTRLETWPVPIVEALVDFGDRRVVTALLEELAPDHVAKRIESTREKVRSILGGDVAELVCGKLETRLTRKAASVPTFLFTITHENLGEDTEAWLSWWDTGRSMFPPQIARQVPYPRAKVRIAKGEEPRAFSLDDAFQFALGRDEKSNVALTNPSVSRLHATILRFHTRLVIRDEGSRFGTVVNGSPVRMAFLGHGDRIVLGKVELVFESELPVVTLAAGEPEPIDPDAWLILEQSQHPSTAQALIRFLEPESHGAWIDIATARLVEDPKRAASVATKLRERYAQRAKVARELLPQWLGPCDAPDNPAAWLAQFRSKQDELPPQVAPEGWFPPREGDPKTNGAIDVTKLNPDTP
jgi:pSer/pThr/pTyr-binding forkhead associated (FHA) protein